MNTETTPAPKEVAPRISVDATALRSLLVALNGPGHLIRELQFTRDNPPIMEGNPIDTLTREFNEEAERAAKEVPQPASGDAVEFAMECARQYAHAYHNEATSGTTGIQGGVEGCKERLRAAILAASGAPQEAPGDAPDLRLVMCPACFVEVSREDADRQTLDARRYRWLREHRVTACPSLWSAGLGFHVPLFEGMGSHNVDPDDLDAAIDAAMKGPQ